MESELLKIEKLNSAEQFPIWKFQIKIVLKAGDLFELVSGEKTVPVKTRGETASDFTERLKAWQKLDNQAQKCIVTSIGKGPLQHVINCSNSREMWDRLSTVYEQRSKANIHMLQQRFYAFSKSTEDDVATHISKLETLVRQLKDAGEEISESMVITKILMTLPESYNHFYSAWESTPTEQQTLTNLTSRLIMEDIRHAHQTQHSQTSQLESALMAKKWKKSEKQFNGVQPQNRKNNKPGKCFLCHDRGHWKKDCPKRKLAIAEREINDTEKSSRRGDAFVCDANVFLEIRKDRNSKTWFLDSGASDHMSPNREWFINFKVLNKAINVRVGNGEVIAAEGVGDINIRAFDGEKWTEKHLLNVLYVPNILMNLFSQSSALDKGLTLCSTNEKCIFKKDECIVAVGERRGQLFEMRFEVVEEHVSGCSNVAKQDVSLKLWHERLAHQSVVHVKNVLKYKNIDFFDTNFFCDPCAEGKLCRQPFGKCLSRAKSPAKLVHADLCEPMQQVSIGKARYFLLLKDDFSNYRTVYFLKEKSDVCYFFETFIRKVKADTGCKISVLRTDNGLEFVNNDMEKLLKKEGIIHQKTCPYTPQQNGRAEREMRTIVEAARTMIHAKNLSLTFWAEAVNTAVFILNRSGPTNVNGKCPYELWCGEKSRIDNFKVFGSECFIHVPKEKGRKFDKKALKGVMIGYEENVKGYRVWVPSLNKIEISRDVIFNENTGQESVTTDHINKNCDDTRQQQTVDYEKARSEEEQHEVINDNGFNTEPPTTPLKERLRSARRICNVVDVLENHEEVQIGEPKSYADAISGKKSMKWKNAMDAEMDSLLRNHTWDLVNVTRDRKVIDNKWVYKIKGANENEGEIFKARLVVRGFTQQFGVDYEETFSPVAKFTSIRTILATAAAEGLQIKQFDIKTAFFNGVLDEEIYMNQPEGYDDGSGKVCKLKKALYGLKQGPRRWNEKFSEVLKKFKLQASNADPCVFVNRSSGSKLVLAIYVDDGLVAGKSSEDISKILTHLNENFEVKVFKANYFLGMEIRRLNDGSVHLSQVSYTNKILQRYRMTEANPVKTPAEKSTFQIKTSNDEVNFPYREAVGSLMYLAIATRPDIAFSVGVVSRHLDCPSREDITAVKRILRYLKETKNHGILYNCNSKFSLNGFSAADYGGDVDTRRSTTGYTFLMYDGIISWCSQLQKCVALSTTESEYVAASEAIKELMWLKELVGDVTCQKPIKTTLFIDNQRAIKLIRNPEFHKRTKHIDIRFHFVREKFKENLFDLHYVSSDKQLADIFTKIVPKVKFEELGEALNIVPL